MKKTTTNDNGITAIYVRRSVIDKDKGNNGRMTHQSCLARIYRIRIGDIEDMVYKAMCERMESLEIVFCI